MDNAERLQKARELLLEVITECQRSGAPAHVVNALRERVGLLCQEMQAMDARVSEVVAETLKRAEEERQARVEAALLAAFPLPESPST